MSAWKRGGNDGQCRAKWINGWRRVDGRLRGIDGTDSKLRGGWAEKEEDWHRLATSARRKMVGGCDYSMGGGL